MCSDALRRAGSPGASLPWNGIVAARPLGYGKEDMPRIRVLLVDDHVVVRHGIRRLLDLDPDITVVGEAGDGRQGVDLARSLSPHVAIVDIGLPELNGIEATRRMMRLRTPPRVLVLSMHADPPAVRDALRAGARGFLVKDEQDLDLGAAVRTLAAGGTSFSSSIASEMLRGYQAGATAEPDALVEHLTSRQREVVQLIAEGKTNRQIAGVLAVSMNTVESHRKHLMDRLALHTTADVVRFAIAHGIVRDPALTHPARNTA
jgi:two-component system, NarL family, response regulator NreC